MQRYNLYPAEFPPGGLQEQQPSIPLNTGPGHHTARQLWLPNTIILQTQGEEGGGVQVAADYQTRFY